MGRDRDFTGLGRALSTPARSVFLNLLMDGTRRPASELAQAAGVSASTASEHLGTLVDSGLVVCAAHGRHRYYSLAGPDVATALETLGVLAHSSPARFSGYRHTRQAEQLAAARFCYDHLAGRLGVALAGAWVDAGWLTSHDELTLTETGVHGLHGIGVDVHDAIASRRATTRACLDWTERRPHLAGALGAAVGKRFLDTGWVTRRDHGRGLDVTESGHEVLRAAWNIDLSGAIPARPGRSR